MPVVSVGLAEIEQHLRAVRQRLNASTVQHAVYLSGSVVALATTLLIVLALRSGESWFSIAAWFAIAAVATSLAGAAWYTRREWRSLDQIAHLADRQAALDDRIATALAPPHAGARLSDLLIDQILTARPHWDERALAPRRVPRSAYLLALSLAALAVISFYVRPPASPEPPAAQVAHAANTADSLFEPPGAGASKVQSNAGTAASTASAPGETGGVSTAIAHGPAASPPDGSGAVPSTDGAVGGEAARSASDGVPSTKGSATDGTATSAGLTSDMQTAIRRAFGAADDANPAKVATDRRGSPGSSAQEQSDQRQASAQDGLGTDANRADRNGEAQPQPPGERAPSGGPNAGRPGGGTGAGVGAEGLFGAQPLPAPRAADGTEPMALKLSTFAGAAPSHQAPQRDAPPVSGQVAAVNGPGGSAPLADEQVPDAALQKADVAPEHEAIVQRIFTRDE